MRLYLHVVTKKEPDCDSHKKCSQSHQGEMAQVRKMYFHVSKQIKVHSNKLCLENEMVLFSCDGMTLKWIGSKLPRSCDRKRERDKVETNDKVNTKQSPEKHGKWLSASTFFFDFAQCVAGIFFLFFFSCVG